MYLIHPKHIQNILTCSNRAPSTGISHSNPASLPNTITMFSYAVTFRLVLLHPSTKRSIISSRSCSSSQQKTKSSACEKPGNFHSLPSINIYIILPILNFISSVTASTLALKSQVNINTTLAQTPFNPEILTLTLP